MFAFDSSLFWYKIVFMAELIISEFIFVAKLRRRDYFLVKVSLCVIGLLSMAFLMPIAAFNAVWTSFMFISLFLISLAAIKICFDESWWNVIFCGLAAYIVQHLAYVVFNGVVDIAALLFGYVREWSPYSETGAIEADFYTFVTIALYLSSYFLVYWIAYYSYAQRIKLRTEIKLGDTRFVVLAGIIILTAVIFSLIAQYSGDVNTTMIWLEKGYSLLTCTMALQLQFGQLSGKEMQNNLNIVQQILYEEQKQYEVVKQNIDIINLKCHDLKQQLRTLRLQDREIDRAELKQIESAINIYEAVVNTGNETLDLILTDKNLICRERGIQLTCIADGIQLDFIRPADIYALFGNALDNAIDAVTTLPKPNRNISLYVKKVGNLISIHIENYFLGTPDFKDGLPLTTKDNRDYHGFGMLSIKAVAEKYGGNVTVDAFKNIFNLNILFHENNGQA